MLTALTGAATYVETPLAGPVVRTFSAAFPRDQGNGPAAHGTTQDTQTGSATVLLNITNLTSVAFSFTFTDNFGLGWRYPAGATFRVTSPEGNTSEAVCQPGASSSATIQFTMINIPPNDMVFLAEGESEAARKASAKNPACETGSGDWMVEVTVQRDIPIQIPRPGASISWSLTTRVEWYSLQITELLRS